MWDRIFFARDLFLEKTTYQAWLKLKQAAEMKMFVYI